MAKFIVHTVVHQDQKPVFFEPGDTVPAWAESLVGDHVIDGRTGDTNDATGSDEPKGSDDSGDSEGTEESNDIAEPESTGDTKVSELDFSAKATKSPARSAAKTARKK